MGKVGSRTLHDSLETQYGKERVFHVHNHKKAQEKITQWSQNHSNKVIVITGFREPLNRCISAYFQNLTNEKNYWFVGEKKSVLEKNIDWFIHDYNMKIIPHINLAIKPWLERYESVIGYQLSNFYKMGTYWKASKDNIYFYIYKLETFTEFSQEISNNSLFKNIRFINKNIGSEKWYGKLYQEFKQKFKISANNYNKLYKEIDYVQYLYSDEEIENLIKPFLLPAGSVKNTWQSDNIIPRAGNGRKT